MKPQARAGVAVAALFLPALGASLLSSCNLIVGAGDFAVASGVVKDSGAPEGGGKNGEGGTTKCGQGLPTTPDFKQLVTACVYAVSCDPENFNDNISRCITNDYLEAIPAHSCLSTITSCDLFYDCEGLRITTSDDCPDASSAATCETINGDSVAVNCSSSTVQDCTKFGGTCGTHSDEDGGTAEDGGTLTIADCIVVPSCSNPTDGISHCEGNELYTCINGKGFGQSCSDITATCGLEDGGATCFYDLPPCKKEGYSCSAAGALEFCTPEMEQVTYDCTKAGGTCAIDNSGNGSCVSPGCPQSDPNTCDLDDFESCGDDGVTLTVCVGGAPLNIDCSKLSGFSGCDVTIDDSTLVTYGFCE
jgi:hypothetical protein